MDGFYFGMVAGILWNAMPFIGGGWLVDEVLDCRVEVLSLSCLYETIYLLFITCFTFGIFCVCGGG